MRRFEGRESKALGERWKCKKVERSQEDANPVWCELAKKMNAICNAKRICKGDEVVAGRALAGKSQVPIRLDKEQPDGSLQVLAWMEPGDASQQCHAGGKLEHVSCGGPTKMGPFCLKSMVDPMHPRPIPAGIGAIFVLDRFGIDKNRLKQTQCRSG